jgi:hypothetical protein
MVGALVATRGRLVTSRRRLGALGPVALRKTHRRDRGPVGVGASGARGLGGGTTRLGPGGRLLGARLLSTTTTGEILRQEKRVHLLAGCIVAVVSGHRAPLYQDSGGATKRAFVTPPVHQ